MLVKGTKLQLSRDKWMADANANRVDDKSNVCLTCAKVYASYWWRRVHDRLVYPDLYHVALTEAAAGSKKMRWDREEEILMATHELKHPALSTLDLCASIKENILPHRTVEGIKCHPNRPQYKWILEELRSTHSTEVL